MDVPRNPIILHLDFDSFFASVEQQDNPKFRGKPVGITATNGRTAIIAASREAKALGIANVTRTYDAVNICPWIIITPAHFQRYFEVSKQFLAICNQFSPTVELFSIDEAFLDVTLTVPLFGGVESLVKMIKYKIAEKLGPYITVSIGVSYNKLLAKLASGLNKPNGFCEVTKENIWNVYKQARLTDVCGIGYRINQRLQGIGIYTLLQLRDTPLEKLIDEFGIVEGHFLKNVGLGIDTEAVIPYRTVSQVKSVGRNYCLPKNEYNKRIIYQNVFELCEEIGIKLRRLGKKAKTLGLSLRGSTVFHERKTYTYYFDSGVEIFQALLNKNTSCQARARSLLAENGYVRMISVWSAGLIESSYTPLSLFDKTYKKDALQKTIDAINDKFGDHTIRNGFLLYADKLTTVPNGFGIDTWDRKQLAQEELTLQ